MLCDAEMKALIAGARRAQAAAYAPYSKFKVGSAVVGEDDRVFFGCNVENASYGLSLCAERVAISAAVCAGVRRIKCIVVVTDAAQPATPCGACRQWMAEFGTAEMEVVSANSSGNSRRFTLAELLPEPFRLD